jgi:replicative DNA helicase
MDSPQKRPSRKNSAGRQGQRSGEALDRASAELLRKVPPHNLEAEQAVIGGVFVHNAIFHELVDLISSEDFYSPAHQMIFASFEELYRRTQPIDLITAAEELARMERLEQVGGPVYLSELAASVVSAGNALHHAKIVREKSARRQLIQAAGDIISQCFEADNVETLLDGAEQKIFEISDQRSSTSFVASKDAVDRVFDILTKRVENHSLVTGVPTGYEKMDEMTAGMQPSDLIIIAGRPSMGKTAFALNVALKASVRAEKSVAVFSLEMSTDQLIQRLLCIQGKVELSRVRTGFHLTDEDWGKLYDAAHHLSGARFFIDDTPALSTMELRARCRRLKAEKGLDMVVVDYLQLMRSSTRTDSREQEISDISRNLKALAKEMNIPVIALSQLNRKVEERTDKRPMLSDLRESGAIEQDADVIMFLYREEFYKRKEGDGPRPLSERAEVILGKQRNGPIGVVELNFLNRYTAFENLNETPYPSEYGE